MGDRAAMDDGDVNDPSETLAAEICCDAQRGIFYNDVVGSDPRTKGST